MKWKYLDWSKCFFKNYPKTDRSCLKKLSLNTKLLFNSCLSGWAHEPIFYHLNVSEDIQIDNNFLQNVFYHCLLSHVVVISCVNISERCALHFSSLEKIEYSLLNLELLVSCKHVTKDIHSKHVGKSFEKRLWKSSFFIDNLRHNLENFFYRYLSFMILLICQKYNIRDYS